MRVVGAHYENGALLPAERLGLRPDERVNLIVLRRPDPGRWDWARLAKTAREEDLLLSGQGLEEWAEKLD
jgi:predicted DNA-binding antitoxin AbrB/MazE fold protein